MQYQIPSPHAPIQGATVQATHPIPPVSQPQFAYYRPDINRAWISVGPRPQLHQGATLQRTDPIPPPSQPVFNYYKPDANRSMWVGPERQYAGATTHQTYVFQPGQPELSRFSVVLNAGVTQTGPTKQLTGATLQDWFIYPQSQPDHARVNQFLQSSLFLVQAPKHFDGSTVQQTFIFPVSQPLAARVVFPESSRFIPDVVKRFDGAITAQTYVFPPNQPDPARTDMLLQQNRFIVDVVKRFDGVAQQETFFALLQPRQTITIQQPAIAPRIDAPTQTDVFQLRQPPIAQWVPHLAVQQPVSTEVPPPQAGPIPSILPGPEISQFTALNRNRYIIGTIPQLETFIPPVVIPIRPVGMIHASGPTGLIVPASATSTAIKGDPRGATISGAPTSTTLPGSPKVVVD